MREWEGRRAWKKGWPQAWWESRWQGWTSCALCHPLPPVLGAGGNFFEWAFSYKYEPVAGCSLWFSDLLSPSSPQTGWPLFLQPLCHEAPFSPLGVQASLQPSPWKDPESKHLAHSSSCYNGNDLPFGFPHCKPGGCHFPLPRPSSPQLCFSCTGSTVALLFNWNTGCLRRCTSSGDSPTIRTWCRQYNSGNS